jgi:hypothetical protein
MRYTVLFALALGTTAALCTPPEIVNPPPSADAGTADAETPDGPTSPCEAMCVAYRRLGCSEGKPTKQGHACEEVCQNALANGITVAGPATCSNAAQSCEAVRACG